jgi:hypothetical protein
MNHYKRILAVVLLPLLSLFGSGTAQASYVDALSEMAIGNLRFFSTDSSAQLDWTDVWYGTVTAHAQDTDSGQDDDFADLLGNGGSILAEAQTAHVYSLATYEVVDGDQVAIRSGDIGAATHSDLLLTHPNKQADGFAIGTFDNFFTVTGGTAGNLVQVTFELDYDGVLDATADAQGFFSVALLALLEIEDLSGNSLGGVDVPDPPHLLRYQYVAA